MANYQEYTTRIFLNDAQAQDKIQKLRNSINQYKKDKDAALQKGGKEGDKAWKEAEKNIRRAEAELKKLSTTSQSVNRVLGNLKTSSVKEIKQTIIAINREMQSGAVARGTKEWKALTQQLKKAKTELANIQSESSAHSKKGFFASMRDGLNNNWGAITQFIGGVTALSFTIRKATQQYAEMEEAMANVRKYTGQTAEEVKAMNEEFKEIDTRTSREELNALASAAGRLGITSHDEIMEFVDAADKINVALGEDLGKDAVATIGKLAMAFGEDETMGLRGAMLATGSAVNELAQNSSASANYLVDFAARLSGIGQVAGMTQSQIIGLGSVMDENMQRDEMASTAISKLITSLAADSSKFAKIAGIDVKEFADLVEKDMNGALLKLAGTLKSKGGLMQLAPMFADMGLDGARAVGVLTVLANKVDDVRKYQQLATKAYEEGVSVINEFNVQNNTVQAGIDKNIKKFQDLSSELGEKLLPVVKYTISSGSLLIKGLSTLITFTSKYATTLITLTTVTAALYALKVKDVAIDKIKVFWNEKLVGSFSKLWKVIMKNPYAAIAVAVTTVIALFVDLAKKTHELTEAQKAMDDVTQRANASIAVEKQRLKTLTEMVHNNALSLNDRKRAIEEIQKIAPGYRAEISKEGKVINENTEALKKYNKQLERKALLQGAKEVLEELGRKDAQYHADKMRIEREMEENEEEAERLRKIADIESKSSFGSGDISPTRVSVKNIAMKQLSLKADLKEIDEKLAENTKAMSDVSGYAEELNQKLDETKENKTTTTTETTSYSGGGGGGGSTHNSGKDKRIATLKKAENEELQSLKEHMIALGEQYASGNMDYTEYLTKQRDLQLKSIKKREDIWKGEAEQLNNLAKEKLSIQENYERRMLRMSDMGLKRMTAARAAEIQAQFYDEKSEIYMNEDALNEALFQNDMDYYDAMLATRKKGSEEYLDIEAEKEQRQLERKYQKEIHYHEMLSQYKRDWGEMNNVEEMNIALNGLEELHREELIEEKDYQRMRLLIQEHFNPQGPNSNSDKFNDKVSRALTMARNRAGDAGNPNTDNFADALFNNDIENWKNVNKQLKDLYEEDVISKEEANAAKAQNDADYLNTLLARTQLMYDMINNVVNAAAAYSKACSDLEVKNIEKNYDKQIKAAGNNSARKKKIEERRDEEIRKAKNKASKKAMKIEIAQAIATSAMSALDAYASVIKALPFPANMAMAPIAAAMALAAGALQIATIKKQHAAEASGFYKGGFTKGSDYHREAGVVHEGEFVANHNAVNNPSLLPALKLIDTAQRNNTVGSLTANDIHRAIGDTQAAPIINIQTDEALQRDVKEAIVNMNEAVRVLNAQIQRGIYAYATIDGENGVKKQLDKYNRLMANK